MTKATLVILRHGQTEYNLKKLMTGQRDVPLTPVGEEQARAAGKLVAHIHFDKVYSSPLSRAFNTAALALSAARSETHLLNTDGSWQIEMRKEVIELDTGDFTGRCHKTDPEIIDKKRDHGFDVPLPHGESEKQVVERIRAFFASEVLPRLLNGENVLIVAHSGIVRLFDIAIGLEAEPTAGAPTHAVRKTVPNAAPLVYEYVDGNCVNCFSIENPKDPANQNQPPAAQKKNNPKL